MTTLEIAASISEIATAVVALGVAIWYAYDLSKKRQKLEDYLQEQKATKPLAKDGREDHGRRTIPHIIAALKMTQEDVLHAAWRSKKIIPQPHINKQTNLVEGIYLEYKG